MRQLVREGYAKIAQENSAGCCGSGVSCCGSTPQEAEKLARELGYTVEELQALPDGANMGLSCGNPAALAALKPGETVLDLGSGGGFDVFIAGRKVGATGRAIGVDMTPEMLGKARNNIAHYRKETGLDNVEFRLGEIEHLPVADNSVDAIISNCVINLSPDKAQVWREMARVLKPGGRVAVSDMALLEAAAAGSFENGGGADRLRGRRGAGVRNRPHGQGGRTDGHRSQIQARLRRGAHGLGGPALQETHGTAARWNQAGGLHHQPGSAGAKNKLTKA